MPVIFARVVRSEKRKRLIEGGESAIREVQSALETEVKQVAINYTNKVVENWKNKPKFTGIKTIRQNKIQVTVEAFGPNAKYWVWTSRGTRPHLITAKYAPNLIFKRGYDSKTKVGPPPTFGGSGRRFGQTISKKFVNHPGTEPRHFEEHIAEQMRQNFRRIIENAFRRGIRRG